MGKCEIIELTPKLFFRTTIKERRFYYEAGIKITRKEAREHLAQFHLANSEIMIRNIWMLCGEEPTNSGSWKKCGRACGTWKDALENRK